MKQIRLNTTMAGPEGVKLKGSVVTVDDETAAQLVAAGAQLVDAAEMVDDSETAEAAQSEQAIAAPQRTGSKRKSAGRR